MTRILVTGTSGFIGTSFCEKWTADRNDALLGLDRVAPREKFRGVTYKRLDLTNEKSVERTIRSFRPEVVVHLAAQARVDPSLVDPLPTLRDNVLATMNLVSVLRSLNLLEVQFVYASSETVYGAAEVFPTPENTPLNPQSPYAASKAAAEMIVRSTLPDHSLILRSGMGYGPRSDPKAQVIARFVERALRDEGLLFPSPIDQVTHPTRDVNFVTNFLDGLALGIDKQATGTLNIGSGKEISVLEIARRVVQVVGGGRILEDPGFHYRPGEEGVRTWLDVSRARSQLGYVPKVELNEGISRTADWMRETGQLPKLQTQ